MIAAPPGLERDAFVGFEVYNSAQRALWADRRRFQVVPAGRRSGKTHLARMDMLRRVVLPAPYRDSRIVLAAPTRPQAKTLWWEQIKATIPAAWIVRVRESELSLRLVTGWTVQVMGMERPQRAVGAPIDHIVLDEYATMKANVWKQYLRPALDTRGRPGTAWLIGVPEGRNHYWDVWCEAQLQGDVWGAHTWKSAEVLPEAVIAQAMRDLDERTFRQEYEASFEEAVGRIYYAFDRRMDVEEFDLPAGIGTSMIPWVGGIDFNVNPMTAVWGWERELPMPDGTIEKHAFIYDQFAIPNADTAVAARTIRERVEDVSPGRFFGQFVMHPDPSGAARRSSASAGTTDHTILRDHGFRLSFRSAAPKRRDRWNATNAMFCNAASRRRTHVHPRCVRLIRDLEGVIYREGTSEPDEAKCGTMLHITDALGYWFELRHMVGAGAGPGSFDPRAVFTN